MRLKSGIGIYSGTEMTVGVLIITHQDFGDSMLRIARKAIKFCPLKVETLPIDFDCIP
jgi:hypothetical protein